MGPLSPYIKRTAAQISWGVPFTKSIKNLASTIESKIVKQSFIVISEAFEMGGNVVDTMRDLAKNINSIKEINERRISAISQQIMIMYFIFFIFLATLVGIYKMLIPMLSIDINMSGGLMSMGSEMEIKKKDMPNFCEIPPIAPIMCSFGALIGFDKDLNVKEYDPSGMFGSGDGDGAQPPPDPGEGSKESTKSTFLYFKSLFFLMCLVQATCTGVIAGVLKSGKVTDGIPHVAFMYVATVCVFILFV
ncbi:MAG: type II secretion system F family protein, partial [Candidatus Aenigmarchaeota archaeon]|nr:type II secretion system F family protein [Candidatus Aenigmarchaeota archaeon]